MNDRELLELSAKAAGHITRADKFDVWIVETDGSPISRWNPLADDAQALRLAVKLSMEVYVDQHPEGCDCTEVWSTLHPDGQAATVIINHDGDPYAATRRAIVHAAAEIGKTRSE